MKNTKNIRQKSYILLIIGAILLIASVIFTVYAHNTSYEKSQETAAQLSEVKKQIADAPKDSDVSALEEQKNTSDTENTKNVIEELPKGNTSENRIGFAAKFLHNITETAKNSINNMLQQSSQNTDKREISTSGTVIDTLIICTMTGLSIVITDTWNIGLDGVDVTTKAFQIGLPFPEQVSSFLLMLCLVFFAFTTILGWNYYSEKCLEYLIGNKPAVLKGYRWLYILAVFIGPFMTVSAVWTIADIFNGLMALPNLVALVALSGVVVQETKKYFEKLN